MRTILVIAGILVAAVVGVFALVPALISEDAIRAQIAQQISAWTGREVSVGGESTLSLFPEPAVTLRDLRIAGPSDMPDSDVMVAESLSGTVRLLPLLIGEVEIGSFEIGKPTIRLINDEEGRRNWIFDSSAAALQLAFSGNVLLGRFRIRDGMIVVEDRLTGKIHRLEEVDLKANWPSVRDPFSFRAKARWSGERVRLDIALADPFAYISGDATPATATLTAAPLNVTFDGAARDIRNPRLAGDFNIDAPSLRRFMRWFGQDVDDDGPALGAVSMVGVARYESALFSLDDARITLDGNEAAGALRIALGTRPVIEGTIAYDQFDLTPYAAVISDDLNDPDRPWSTINIDSSWLDQFSADLRISANSIVIGPVSLARAAASVLVKNEAMEIGLARAAFYGGTLSGNLSMVEAAAGTGTSLSARLKGEGFRLADVLAAGAADTGISGTATMAVDLQTTGRTVGDLFADMTGTLGAQIVDGVIPGVDLGAVAAAIDRGDASPPTETATTSTTYRLLDAAVLFGGRAALLQRAVLEGNGFASRLAGTIGLDDGMISLSAYMATESGGEQETPFEIVGTVGEPQVVFSRTN